MKIHFLLVCIIAVGLFFLNTGLIYASSDAGALTLQQQINIISSEIHNLKSLLKSMESTEAVTANAYIVMDAESKKIILEKNSGQQYPIASITKLMNAVVTLENIDTKTTVRLTKAMLKPAGHSPSLFLNSKISVGNLLKASLIQSVNDAAQALSNAVGAGKFVNLMNQKAKVLGMENTVYYDAHGLNPKNVSTADDLAKLANYIYQKHPEILDITKDNNFWLPDAKGKLLKFKNLNNFYIMPDFIGGKTGRLIEAKETMASLFVINGKPVIVVVLYSGNAQADTLKLVESAKKTLSL